MKMIPVRLPWKAVPALLALFACCGLMFGASDEEESSHYVPERDGFTVHEWGLIRQAAEGHPLPHDTIPSFVHTAEAPAMR